MNSNTINIKKVSLKIKVLRSLWNVTYILLFRPFGTKLFLIWRLFLLKLFGANVKYDSGVYSSVKIWAPWNLTMESGSWLGPNVICYNQAMITIKKDAVVSQYAFLCTAGHDTSLLNTKKEGLIISPIIINEGAWIGARAYIGMGVEIGKDSIVGATASVYKDIEPMTIVGGNPAKVIKKREI